MRWRYRWVILQSGMCCSGTVTASTIYSFVVEALGVATWQSVVIRLWFLVWISIVMISLWVPATSSASSTATSYRCILFACSSSSGHWLRCCIFTWEYLFIVYSMLLNLIHQILHILWVIIDQCVTFKQSFLPSGDHTATHVLVWARCKTLCCCYNTSLI